MHWVAPSEKENGSATLEKRLWDAADQFRANSGLKAQEYSGPILGLIFLRFAEVRFAAQLAKLQKSGDTVAFASSHSQGATIPYAVWDGSFSEMPVVLPSAEVLHRFEDVVAPMLSWLAQSFFTLDNLRRTRDLLLPRLLSGQVNLSAA